MRRHMLALIYGLACLVGVPGIAALADIHGAGFVDLSLTDPVEGGPMPAFVSFRASRPAVQQGLGPTRWMLRAEPNQLPVRIL